MSEQEKEAIENTKKKIEATQKGLEEGKYYGERFNLEQDIKREQVLLNYIDKLQKENEKLKELVGFTTIRIKTDDIKMLTKDFISKDKIRNKIEEEKKRKSYIISMYAIGILEELLENN